APTLFAAPVPDPIHVHEMKTLLEQCISQLPRSHRAVYLLREIQHLTTAETAACLGLSRENVKVCLHRAREGLKAQLLKSSAGVELFDYPAQFCDPVTARVMLAIHSAWRAARKKAQLHGRADAGSGQQPSAG
ncbi:MAG TPA: sigma factor-like helix-turn-helix DNA-binding protein, partial [Opitutus sp.]|nr:sigma factor-like helix-turn-helix DNA-binding protein [Opitutus sp.]